MTQHSPNSASIRNGFAAFITAFVLMTVPLVSWPHSAMYDDYFEFDNSNDGGSLSTEMRAMLSSPTASSVATRCVNGSAAGYPCDKVDLQSFVPKASMGSASANLNDIWGWTDVTTGREIAIVGFTNGTAFVDVTDSENPVYLGKLNSHNGGVDSWRDMKIYNDHAFIVADGSGNSTHGMQVFDLRQLRNISNPPVQFSETAHFGEFGNAHNIAINEDTGFAYVVGSNQCSGGLYMINIGNPQSPSFAGCFSQDGYTHDTQCVVYSGPDTRYTGREICVAYNEDTITIVDVTSKSNPVQLSRSPYSGSRYTHQGWFLNDSQQYLIMNDELDEQGFGSNTVSHLWDASSLTAPFEVGRYTGPTAAVDHNLYTLNDYVFEANYRAGLRILSSERITQGTLDEVAWFDVVPNSDSPQFSGLWSSYIYFASGNVIVSDIESGLFVLRPDWQAIGEPEEPEEPEDPTGVVVYQDDFESGSNWQTNPNGSDSATTGQWEVANPEPTADGSTPMQPGDVVSGVNGLITGASAGGGLGGNDIDSGVTSVRSPAIALPSGSPVTLSFQYYFAHLNNAASDDYFRVAVVDGGQTNVVFERLGAAQTRAGRWQQETVNLDRYAGRTIRLLISAADNSTPSLIEAGVDDVTVRGPEGGNGTPPSLTVVDVRVSEGDGAARVQVQLSEPATEPVTVTAFTRAGSARGGATFTVPVLDDSAVEGDETFGVRLINAVNATIADNEATVTITDNDTGGGSGELSVSSLTVAEGEVARVPVRLSEASSGAVSVLAFTQVISATPGADYYGVTERLEFAPGETEKFLSVTTLADSATEGLEEVRIRLTDATGASIATDRAVLRINDGGGSAPPVMNVASASVNEGAGTASVRVTLSASASQAVSASVFTQSGSASGGGEDFVGFTRTITFQPGETAQTVSVSIVDDADQEGTETFRVRLTDVVNAEAGTAGTVTITDND